MLETARLRQVVENYNTNPSCIDLNRIQELRDERQWQEVAAVLQGADAIEQKYAEFGIPLPTVINLFTAGFNRPDGAQVVGVYGDEVFPEFPRPDILGHEGTVSALGSITFMNGRAHPNEWAGNEYAAMIAAHSLQVWKEIARRQRARGIDPLIVLTYLTGVREGHVLKPGDVGIILDDTELTNVVHPGHGPRGILDRFFGDHFQAKAGRSSNLNIAKEYADFARATGYTNLYPVAVCGTPGTTEFQSLLEVGLLDQAFKSAKGNLKKLSKIVFGSSRLRRPLKKPSLLYGMGPTAELATLRQTFQDEPDFKVLALVLATDAVGGSQSMIIDHPAVVAAAIAEGEGHRDHLLQFENTYDASVAPMQDFSIRAKL